MQFSAVLNIFIVKTKLNSTFTNDLKRKENFSKNVHSYRQCSFNMGSSKLKGRHVKRTLYRQSKQTDALLKIVSEYDQAN